MIEKTVLGMWDIKSFLEEPNLNGIIREVFSENVNLKWLSVRENA